MNHTLTVDQHGFLHSKFVDNINEDSIDQFIENIQPHLQNASSLNQLHFVADAAKEGRWALAARRKFTKLFNEDARLGLVAVYNLSRTQRVISSFMVKAAGKHDEVRFFATQEEALDWLLSLHQPA